MPPAPTPYAMSTQAEALSAAQAFNTANAAWRTQDWAGALAAYSQACELDASLAAAHLGRARCLVKQGQWMPAREAFAAVLRLDANHFSAWLEAGHLCRQQGELQQAIGAYQRAISLQPDRHEAHLGLARALLQLKEPSAARQAFEQVLRTLANQPERVPEVARFMGQYALEAGEAEVALQALRAGLPHARGVDERAELQIDMGEALWRLGLQAQAQQVLTEASAAQQESTLARLGALAFRLNFWQEALAVLRRAIELYPTSLNARWNLAHLLAECWQMEEAEVVLAQAEALGPVPGAPTLRAAVAGKRGEPDVALAIYRELAFKPGAPPTMASSTAMSSLYSDSLSAQQVAQLHRELFAPLGAGARPKQSFVRAPLAGRRLRLGLVTADFHHQHPVNIFMQPMLRELDRSRFEVFVFFTGVSYDEQTRLARSRVDHWIEVTTLADGPLAKRIDAEQIDVLLDLAGHTGQQRMPLFAQRAAPAQVTYLGYPGSTGVPNIDWLIGDAMVTPLGTEELYSERIARLPGTVFCYAPEVDYPFPVWGDERAHQPLTFGSFNNLPKLTPRTLKLWSRVLQAVPGSRLLIKAPSFSDAGAQRLMLGRLEALGVGRERVELRGPTGLTDMMAEYADVDIALDTVPYNGGTTSLQAMWMGAPVLCQMGEHFVSRMGASFMVAAGLSDWVTAGDDSYVATAQRMAADRPALLALKRGMRQRLLGRPAWDVKAHTRAFEAAIEQMARCG
jgi:protein O-GlcNAc transferase